jgi:hypothetical protein
MKVVLLPKTLSGKWSLGLSIAFIILIFFKILYSLHVPTFAIAALGLAGFVVGIVAILKNRDRALLIFIPIVAGIIIILWTAAEFIFPH